MPGDEDRQDILVLINEGDGRTGPGHLVFRRLEDGAEQFEGQLSVPEGLTAHRGQDSERQAAQQERG